jgi:polysaccharide export outer membrane protein
MTHGSYLAGATTGKFVSFLGSGLRAGRRLSLAALAGLAFTLGLAACSTNYDGLTMQSMGTPPAYKLDAGDRIDVNVFGEENLSGEYEIDQSGIVSLPLAGRITVANLTTQDAERTIAKRLSEGFVSNPNVTVSVVRYRPFYVLGEVARPGGYPFYSGATVLSAVAVAGGYTYRAEKFGIRLLRQGGDATSQPQKITPGTYIEPGDIIIVPERWF